LLQGSDGWFRNGAALRLESEDVTFVLAGA